jgi:ribosomal protein L19E
MIKRFEAWIRYSNETSAIACLTRTQIKNLIKSGAIVKLFNNKSPASEEKPE